MNKPDKKDRIISKLAPLFLEPNKLIYLISFIVLVASIHKMSLSGFFENIPGLYLRNVMSFWNFIAQKDLYAVYPDIYIEAHRYPPSFSLLMAPFSLLPIKLGAILFNLFSLFIFVYGFIKLKIDDKSKSFLLLFSFFEMLTSIQNFQINTLQAGLMVLVFCFMEEKKIFLSAIIITILLNLKLYGAFIGIIFIFYPKKLKFLSLCALCFFIFEFALPLFIVGKNYLYNSYAGWIGILKEDLHNPLSYSVMAITNYLLKINISDIFFQIPSLIILLIIPLLRFNKLKEYRYRLLFLASTIVWLIIFNHKAESPTYIIAVTGVGLWYVLSKKNKIDTALVILVFVFTTLSATTYFPASIRETIGYNVVKTLPCLLVWIKMQFDLIYNSPKNIIK